jgi:hypothetical protein
MPNPEREFSTSPWLSPEPRKPVAPAAAKPHLHALQNSLRRRLVRRQKPLKTSIRAATAR